MGITFGNKRKLKIKIIGQKEYDTDTEAIKEKTSVLPETTEPKPKPKQTKPDNLQVKRNFREWLKESEKNSADELNLPDFTVYQYFLSNGIYRFQKITNGGTVLSEITLERYLSIDVPTIFRRATGLAEASEYRSRLVMLYQFDGKNYIFVWSSILYEGIDNEVISKIRNNLSEMRNQQ